MALPPLAPSGNCPGPCSVPLPQPVPTHSEWATLRPEIERCYVHERRKLRYVMWYMETKYGFKATQQMYKKRFTKWGIQKNPRRSTTTTTPTSMTTSVSSKSSPPVNLGSISISPKPGKDDNLMLMFLASVQSWSDSFYESVQTVQSNSRAPASIQKFPPELNQQMNFTFKLVVDTLNRGHGNLAGRLARKAFLLVEEMLTLDVPALVWNMLEIMHYMVTSSQSQLFRLLLAHLMTLMDSRMPNTHPLPAMLRVLRTCVPKPPDSVSTSPENLLTSSPPITSLQGDDAAAAAESWVFPGAFLFMVERAWMVNAQTLFDRFDDRLFHLYSNIHWDSCSLEPPRAIVDAARQWLGFLASRQISSDTAEAGQTTAFYPITDFEEDRTLQHLLATPTNTSPPKNYEALRMRSIGVLQDHAKSILSRSASFSGDTTVLLRILAGLVTAKVLGEWPATTDSLNSGGNVTARISRGQAANVACAVKTSMDLNAEYGGLEPPLDTVGRMRSIVALREYANPETDPRVIREMWLLEDALVAAGEHQKAFDVKQTACRRLEEYIQDIPVNFA